MNSPELLRFIWNNLVDNDYHHDLPGIASNTDCVLGAFIEPDPLQFSLTILGYVPRLSGVSEFYALLAFCPATGSDLGIWSPYEQTRNLELKFNHRLSLVRSRLLLSSQTR